ncbi:MAG TPA: SPOR domain-containing protein [Holophagaceae bacterium]
MASRDQISISSQSILWVAGVGVGLLTLAFVMGVQVGKQSAALHRPAVASGEEDLQDLPEPLVDQLKVFEGDAAGKMVPVKPVDATAPPAPKPEDAAIAAEGQVWTLQLVATPDAAEAKRVAARAKSAGFATTTARERGQYKVRLDASGDRAAMDATALRLKKAGFKPFPVKRP